jgi:hypothetical protein
MEFPAIFQGGPFRAGAGFAGAGGAVSKALATVSRAISRLLVLKSGLIQASQATYRLSVKTC